MMFGIFKRKSSKTSTKPAGEKPILWVTAENYTFNKVKLSHPDIPDSPSSYSSEASCYNGNVATTHGRIAEMLDEEDMAWTMPRRKSNNPFRLSKRFH